MIAVASGKPAKAPRGFAVTRLARRQGALAMVDHLLRGAARPVNPHRPGSKAAVMFDWGTRQASLFAFPLMERNP